MTGHDDKSSYNIALAQGTPPFFANLFQMDTAESQNLDSWLPLLSLCDVCLAWLGPKTTYIWPAWSIYCSKKRGVVVQAGNKAA